MNICTDCGKNTAQQNVLGEWLTLLSSCHVNHVQAAGLVVDEQLHRQTHTTTSDTLSQKANKQTTPNRTCSFAALSTPVMVPPALPAAYATFMLGYFAWSGCLNVRLLALLKSRRGHVTSLVLTRSGHDMVYMMGSRMSGQPSCRTQPQHMVHGISIGNVTLDKCLRRRHGVYNRQPHVWRAQLQ
jgi:hypothetical protein